MFKCLQILCAKYYELRYTFLADRTNGRAYATVLRLSVCRRRRLSSVVCDVMYCG